MQNYLSHACSDLLTSLEVFLWNKIAADICSFVSNGASCFQKILMSHSVSNGRFPRFVVICIDFESSLFVEKSSKPRTRVARSV